MKIPLQPLAIIVVLVLSTCSPLTAGSPISTDLPESSEPASTVGLPVENTVTPRPEATRTPPSMPDLPELELENGLLEGSDLTNIDVDSLTRYWIDLQVQFERDTDEALLDGVAHIEYTNTTGQPLHDIAFRLWPNDPQYQAQMVAGPVFHDGRPLDGDIEVSGTVLRVPFSLPLEDGDTIAIDIPFRVDAGAFHSGNQRRFGITEGVLIAPTFYPLIPRWLGEDWEVESAPPGGDTTNSEIALYHIAITAPAELSLAVSGIELDSQSSDDLQTVTYVTGPMRDAAFALGPFEETVREVDGVSLRVWTLAEHEDDVDTVLRSAVRQFQLLSNLVGPYPYPELDVVDAPGAFGGIEYPGLVYVGTLGTPWVVEPTVHEVAHQWFYALIGDDQLDEPWLDEAAATFATALYYEAAEGSGRGAGYISELRVFVRNHPGSELPIGLPVGEYQDVDEYGVLVYMKGALFFDTLRQRMGENLFETFLKAYDETYRFGFANAEGFQSVAEGICDCELDMLFDLWVYEGGEIPGLTD